jgi:hypothetical protein
MQVSAIRRTILALGAVAVLALSMSGLPGTPSAPPSAEAAVEAHHRAQWVHVPVSYRFFHSPTYAYSHDWYFHRHISHPSLYRIHTHEPVGICVTEYYFYSGAYYCYVG